MPSTRAMAISRTQRLSIRLLTFSAFELRDNRSHWVQPPFFVLWLYGFGQTIWIPGFDVLS